MTEKVKETEQGSQMGCKKELPYDDMYQLVATYLKKYCLKSDELIDSIWERGRILTFDKKEVVITEGNKFNSLLFVIKGFCASYYYKDDGQESICHFMAEGEFCFLPHAFLNEEDCRLNVRTMTEAILLSISREHCQYLKSKYTEFDQLIQFILEQSTIEHESHYYGIRCYNATERIRKALSTSKIQLLQKHIPQCYIASYLNIAPETFSSIKRKLHNMKK